MAEIEVLKSTYWSKSKAFLYPLTGLNKTLSYPVESYLFWDGYSIYNYQLILYWRWENYDDFLNYCRENIFPVLDKNGYLMETFDGDNSSVFILDMSEWALDIEMFLKGKYSKLSASAKDTIEEHHRYYERAASKIAPEISAALEPHTKFKAYGGLSAIEYVAQEYGFDLDELTKVGELAPFYDKEAETLKVFSAKVA